jgi:8-oxo-dGTP pyrophosphatase MutT (NUDIX family)
MEPHETPEQAATRELLEETGLIITNLEYLIALPDTYGPVPADGEEPDFTLNVYFTANVKGGTLRASDDAVEAQWFGVEELPADDQIAFVHAREVMKHLRKRLAAGI